MNPSSSIPGPAFTTSDDRLASLPRRALWWAMPMLLIVSGPPLLRSELRDPLASLQGKVDIWILWQLGAYAFAGALSLLYLMEPLRSGFRRRHGVLLLLSAMLCILFTASSLWSPSTMTTLGMGLLLGVAMVVTAQFAYSGARLDSDVLQLLGVLRLLAGVLMGLVLLAYLMRLRGIIEIVPTGIRIRGGRLGTQQILGPTVFAISLYFLAFRIGKPLTQLAWIAFSLVVIWTARTRAAYITSLLAALGIWIIWIRDHPQHKRLMQKIGITIVAGALLVGAVAMSTGILSAAWHRGGTADTLSTLNHRTTIWVWTFERIADRPWGFGYSTGFRHMFLNMDEIARDAYRMDGLVVERIGEAHNSHVELLVSAGWPGFILYLSILGIVAARALRALRLCQGDTNLRHAVRLTMVLLGVFMVDGMTTSSYALPTRQCFGMLLFAIGLVLILELRALKARNQRSAAH